MNVYDHTALRLLKAFARLEFALKTFPEFLNGQVGERPETQWGAFYVAVRHQVADNISQRSRGVLLGMHHNDHPPKKMEVTPERQVRFVDVPLQGPPGDRLLEAAKRVRNNLVHGGKEHAHQERYAGHDQLLAEAAIEVIHIAAAAHPGVAPLFYEA